MSVKYLLPFLISCAGPQFVSKHGIAVYTPPGIHVNQAEFDESVENLVLALETLYDTTLTRENIEDIIHRVQSVHFLENWIDCSPIFGHSASCAGLYFVPGVLYVVYNSCLPATALTHEFIHHFLYHTTSKADRDHSTPLLWGNPISVEKITNWISCLTQCAELCQTDNVGEEVETNIKLLEVFHVTSS